MGRKIKMIYSNIVLKTSTLRFYSPFGEFVIERCRVVGILRVAGKRVCTARKASIIP